MIEIETTTQRITVDTTPADVLPDFDTVRWIRVGSTEMGARSRAEIEGATRIFFFPGACAYAARYYVGVPR